MISIIIPTFNRSMLLPRAIESVLRQRFTNWELIIVDDGSTDNTAEEVTKYLRDPRIKYIKKSNTGAADSRNIGVKDAIGEYITFLDSDDEAYPAWLEKIESHISVDKPDLICCGAEKYDHNGKLVDTILPEARENLFGKQAYRMTNGGVFVIKKWIFNEVGGYDSLLRSGQHTELSFRLIPYLEKINGSIVNLYEPLIKVHIHRGDRIRGNSAAKYSGSKRTLEKHWHFFNKRPKYKSEYAGVVAFNASKIGKRKEAIKFSLISFMTEPSPKRFFRILKYGLFSKTN